MPDTASATDWIPVSSSNVDALRWVPDSPYPLQIRFQKNAVYGYAAPYWQYEAILYAGSKGKAVWYYLRRSGVAYTRL